MSDPLDQNRGTPTELLQAGSKIALREDFQADWSINTIVQKIQEMFNLEIPGLGDVVQAIQDGVQFAQQMINQVVDLFNGLVITPINNAIQGVRDWFYSLFNWKIGITSGATGESAPTGVDQAAYDATKALYDQNQSTALAAANAAAAVQQLSQNINGKAGGLNKLLRFPLGTTSTTDWSYTSGQFTNNASNELALPGSAPAGLYTIKSNYTYTTDDQAISAQLGYNVNQYAATYLVLRATNDAQSGVAVRILGNSLAIGTITNGTFTVASSTNQSQTSGDSIEFRAVGNVFVVLLNGMAVLSYSGALGSAGFSNRSSFIVKQKVVPFLTYYSFDLRSVGIYDYGSAGSSVTSRTAVRCSRSNTGNVSLPVAPGGTSTFPANYFNLADFAQNMTVDDLGTGRVKATTADWYEFTCSFTGITSTNGNGTEYFYDGKWCLFVNDVQVTQGIPAGASIKWPLAVNDIAQPAVYMSEVSMQTWEQVSHKNTNAVADRWISQTQFENSLNTKIKGGPGVFFQAVVDT